MASFESAGLQERAPAWDDAEPFQRLWRVYAHHALRSSSSMHGFLAHMQSRQFFVLIETSQKVATRTIQAKEAITGRPDTTHPRRSPVSRAKLQLIYDKHSSGSKVIESTRRATSTRLPMPGHIDAKKAPLKHLSFKSFLDAIVDVARLAYPGEHERKGATASVDYLVPSLLQTVPEDQWLPWGTLPRSAESFAHCEGIRGICTRFHDPFIAIFMGFCRPRAKHISLAAHEPTTCVEPQGWRPAKPGNMRLPQWLAASDAMFYFGTEVPNIMTKHDLSLVFIHVCRSGSRSNPPEISFAEFMEAVCTVSLCVLKKRTEPVDIHYGRPLHVAFQTLDPSEDGAALGATPDIVLKHLIHRIYKSPTVRSANYMFMPLLRATANMLKEDGNPASYLSAPEPEHKTGVDVMQEAGLMNPTSDLLSEVESDLYYGQDDMETMSRGTAAGVEGTTADGHDAREEAVEPPQVVDSVGNHLSGYLDEGWNNARDDGSRRVAGRREFSRKGSSAVSTRGGPSSQRTASVKTTGVPPRGRSTRQDSNIRQRNVPSSAAQSAGIAPRRAPSSSTSSTSRALPGDRKPTFLGKINEEDLRPHLSISKLMAMSDLPEYGTVMAYAARSPDRQWHLPEGTEDGEVISEVPYFGGMEEVHDPVARFGTASGRNFASSNVAIVDSLHTTWIEYFDEEKQLPYYYNVQRSEVQWNRPKGENVVKYDPEVILVARGNQSDVTFAFKEEAEKNLQSMRSKRAPSNTVTSLKHVPSRGNQLKYVRSAKPTNAAKSQRPLTEHNGDRGRAARAATDKPRFAF